MTRQIVLYGKKNEAGSRVLIFKRTLSRLEAPIPRIMGTLLPLSRETPHSPAVIAGTSKSPGVLSVPSPRRGSAPSVVIPRGKLKRHALIITIRGRGEEGTENKSPYVDAQVPQRIPLSHRVAQPRVQC